MTCLHNQMLQVNRTMNHQTVNHITTDIFSFLTQPPALMQEIKSHGLISVMKNMPYPLWTLMSL